MSETRHVWVRRIEQFLWNRWVWERFREKECKLGFQIGFSYLERKRILVQERGMMWVKSQWCLVFFFGFLHFQGKVPVQGTSLSLLVMAILSPVLYLFPHFKFSCWCAQGKHLVYLSPCSDQQTGHFLLHVRSYLEGIFKLKRGHWTVFPSLVVEIPTVIFYQSSGTRTLLSGLMT